LSASLPMPGDDDVGVMGKRLAQQIVRVAGLRDDIEPCLDQDVADSLAHEDVVLADHDAHGRRHLHTVSDRR